MMRLLPFRYYLLPYLVCLLFAVVLLINTAHGDVVLWLNARRNGFLDFFFTYWTHVGDGLVFGVVFIGLVIRRWRVGVVFALTGLVELIVSSTLKRIVFSDVPRPKKYFEAQDVLKFIDGVDVYVSHSFPSGHTMTAFTVCTFLTLMMGRRYQKWSFMLLMAAVLVAVSRMYLLQHFLIDVTVGSALGILIAVSMVMLFKRFMESGLRDPHT